MEQDPDMWMDDGNVVLGAVQKPANRSGETVATTRLFRCHKSVLATHSTIFRDMFALAQSAEAEQYDGVPLVNLPDEAQDVKALLQVLYDPMRLLAIEHATHDCLMNVAKRDLSAIDGILRLAVKYELTTFHDYLAKLVRKWWPNTLGEWDMLATWGTVKMHGRPDFRQLFRLAREAQLPEILPAIFYEANMWCALPDSGAGRPNGETALAFVVDLDAGELVRLIEGRERLYSFTMSLITDVVSNAIQWRMSKHVPCAQRAKKWWETTSVRCVMDMSMRADPLGTLDTIRHDSQKDRHGPPDTCVACARFMNNVLDASRKYLWDRLPSLFGLEEYSKGEEDGLDALRPYLTSEQLVMNAPSKCERMASRWPV